MSLDEEIMQLDVDSSKPTRSLHRNPRRRDSYVNPQSNGNATAVQDTSPFADILASSPVPPPTRSRRLATWADEANENLQNLQIIDGKKVNKQELDNSENDVMPIIPDLEEVRDYEFIQQTAQAPTVQVNKVINFQELDKDMLKHSSFISLDEIDLTPLTTFCLPESQVKEEDIAWNWENLISDITSRLMSDTESNN